MNTNQVNVRLDWRVARVHEQAKNLINHLKRSRFYFAGVGSQFYFDHYEISDHFFNEELDWRYVQEKSVIEDTLAPMAVIARADGLELGLSYERCCDGTAGATLDGIRIAFVVPTDSRGVRVDKACLKPDIWDRSVWCKIDEFPQCIADEIHHRIFPTAEMMYMDAGLICRAHEQYFDLCDKMPR